MICKLIKLAWAGRIIKIKHKKTYSAKTYQVRHTQLTWNGINIPQKEWTVMSQQDVYIIQALPMPLVLDILENV